MEFAQIAKEREQQASLALEDVELQKTALRTEADNRIKEMQLELEAARTVSRISETNLYIFHCLKIRHTNLGSSMLKITDVQLYFHL